MDFNLDTNRRNVTLGLAFIAGIGLTLMIVALGVGVVVAGADIGLWFVTGLLLLIAGVIGWFAFTQPYKHFDDINEPHYHGHDHHHDEEAVTDLGVTDAEGHVEAQLH